MNKIMGFNLIIKISRESEKENYKKGKQTKLESFLPGR